MSQALPAIQRYFQAQSSPGEIATTWQCFSSSLVSFGTYITPENPNYYTKVELQAFVQKFLVGPNVVLTDDLMTQLMKVKQVVLGGDNDKITRAELVRVQQLIATLQTQSIKLLPHLQILFVNRAGVISPDEVTAAHAAMSDFIEALGPYLGNAPIAYDVPSAQALLSDIEDLYTHAGGWDGPKKISNYLNSFAAFKVFLAKAPGNAIAGPEWRTLLHQMTDGYAIWLRYHYAIDPNQTISSDANLAQWNVISTQIRDLVNTAVTQKPNHEVDFATIDAMVHEVYRLDFFSIPLTEMTLKGALRPVLGRILNPVQQGARPSVAGLNTAMLDYILKQVHGLLEMQSLYLQAVQHAGSAGRVTYQTLREVWPSLAHNSNEAWAGMWAIFNAKFPLYVSAENTLVYNDDVASREITSEKFFTLNWQRAAISLAIDGYSDDPEHTQLAGLTAAQFQEIYDDLHPVAEEFGLFKAGDSKTWTDLAQNAEIFVPSSDGGVGVTFSEGIEILNVILSAKDIGRRIFSDMGQECTTVFADSTPAIPISCFRHYFRKNMADQFTNFPDLVASIDGLSDADYNTFLDNLQSVMRATGAAPNAPFTLAEMTSGANFLHYVESIIWRFDQNKDGHLSVSESMVAYPVFKNLLAGTSGFKKDADLKAVFTYLLKYHESPKASLWATVKFLWWKMNTQSWSYNDTRADLVAVIARISEASKTAAPKH